MAQVVRFEARDHIAVITMNRPASLNAINPEVAVGLSDAWERVRDDDNIRVAILTGTGRAFCAGADLGQMIPLFTGARRPEDEFCEKVMRDRALTNRVMLTDDDIGKPIICAINGHAVGGGMEIVQGTDIRIAVPEAKFGLPEVKWGLFPAGGSTVRMPVQMAYAKAMELLLTGDLITADEALAAGFLNYVVPADQLMPKAMEIAAKIAANGPVAVRAIRACVKECLGKPDSAAMVMEARHAAPVFRSEDAVEGPKAFLEKRVPVYRGK